MAFVPEKMAGLLAEIVGDMSQGRSPRFETVQAAIDEWPYVADQMVLALFVIREQARVDGYSGDSWKAEVANLFAAMTAEIVLSPRYQR